MPETALSYAWRGRDERTPREIVADLHRRIAAKSPAHAALVAGFEQRQAGRRDDLADAVARRPPVPSASALRRAERLRRFGELREAGRSREEAAAEVGVGPSAARSYDALWRAGREACDA